MQHRKRGDYPDAGSNAVCADFDDAQLIDAYDCVVGATDSLPLREDAAVRRKELGRYLRARRGQIRPEDVGIARTSGRRVQGLRRTEVAELASVSATWYTWLEQGRDIQASTEVLNAVCRVLRIDEHALRYVRHLAGKPLAEPSVPHLDVDPSVEALLADLLPTPACAVTEAYDLLSWNLALVSVIGDPAAIPTEQRNLVEIWFSNRALHERVADWPDLAKTAIAELRVIAAMHPESLRLRQLIDQLRESNSDFREAWDGLTVRPFFAEAVTIGIPGAGDIHVKVMELELRDAASISIVLFQPLDAQSRGLLQQLVDNQAAAPAESGAACDVHPVVVGSTHSST